MTTMWNATARGPAVFFQHVQDPQIFHESVAERAVELQDVAIGPHASVADEIACVLNRKEVLARGHWAWVVFSQLCLQFIIERIAGFLVPSQFVGRQGFRVSNRS